MTMTTKPCSTYPRLSRRWLLQRFLKRARATTLIAHRTIALSATDLEVGHVTGIASTTKSITDTAAVVAQKVRVTTTWMHMRADAMDGTTTALQVTVITAATISTVVAVMGMTAIMMIVHVVLMPGTREIRLLHAETSGWPPFLHYEARQESKAGAQSWSSTYSARAAVLAWFQCLDIMFIAQLASCTAPTLTTSHTQQCRQHWQCRTRATLFGSSFYVVY